MHQEEIIQHQLVIFFKKNVYIHVFFENIASILCIPTIFSIFALMRSTYGKTEKLKSKKSIEELFDEGLSVSSFPLRLIYLKKSHNSNFPFQMGISVSKRKIARAVDRNRVKRVVREAYRLNKYDLFNETEEQYVAMLLFLDTKEWDQKELTMKLQKLSKKFMDKTKNSNMSNKSS